MKSTSFLGSTIETVQAFMKLIPLSYLPKSFSKKKPDRSDKDRPEKTKYKVCQVDEEGKYLRLEVQSGPYKGETVIVANFPSRAAYYEALRDSEQTDDVVAQSAS